MKFLSESFSIPKFIEGMVPGFLLVIKIFGPFILVIIIVKIILKRLPKK